MAQVVMKFHEPQSINLPGLEMWSDGKKATVDLDQLLTLPTYRWPRVEYVHVLHAETSWPTGEGVWQKGGTRVCVDQDGAVTACGKSIANFIRAMRDLRNGHLQNGRRKH